MLFINTLLEDTINFNGVHLEAKRERQSLEHSEFENGGEAVGWASTQLSACMANAIFFLQAS